MRGAASGRVQGAVLLAVLEGSMCVASPMQSVQSSPYFEHWPGVQKSREILATALSREFFDESVILEKPVVSPRSPHL